MVFWFTFRHQNLNQELYEEFLNRKNDVYLLRFFQVLLQSAPQITYQIHILFEEQRFVVFTVSAVFVSSLALGWALLVLASIRQHHQRLVCLSLVMQMLWWLCFVFSRAIAVVAATSIIGVWIILPIGVHWLAMACWVLFQELHFCVSHVEKLLFSCVIGVVYCFGFVNLNASRARYRMIVFHSICFIENSAMLIPWFCVCSTEMCGFSFRLTALCSSLGVYLLGILCMLVYYRFLHTGKLVGERVVDELFVSGNTFRRSSLADITDIYCNVQPRRTLKLRQPAAVNLELYTPSRLSPILRTTGNCTPGGVSCLDATLTNTLRLDRFHHYSINASDCLTPVLTLRRHLDNDTASATEDELPADCEPQRNQSETDSLKVTTLCARSNCGNNTDGSCSMVSRASCETARQQRFLDICRLKTEMMCNNSQQQQQRMKINDLNDVVEELLEQSLPEEFSSICSTVLSGSNNTSTEHTELSK